MYQRRQLKVDETKESLLANFELRNIKLKLFQLFHNSGQLLALHTTTDSHTLCCKDHVTVHILNAACSLQLEPDSHTTTPHSVSM